MKTCGTCDHRSKEEECCAPIPRWAVMDMENPRRWVFASDKQADDCDCYTPRSETQPAADAAGK